jgi:hypothetical protein
MPAVQESFPTLARLGSCRALARPNRVRGKPCSPSQVVSLAPSTSQGLRQGATRSTRLIDATQERPIAWITFQADPEKQTEIPEIPVETKPVIIY